MLSPISVLKFLILDNSLHRLSSRASCYNSNVKCPPTGLQVLEHPSFQVAELELVAGTVTFGMWSHIGRWAAKTRASA